MCCYTFFCSHKFHKIVNYFIFDTLKKKIWANFQRVIELFTQKIVTKHSKYGFGIRDPGSKRHRITDQDPKHWLKTCHATAAGRRQHSKAERVGGEKK
jgi:hypothetical protein